MLIFIVLLLVGFANSYKSAKDMGKGVSVEIQTDNTVTINHLRIEKYVDGSLIASDNVVNADNSPFEKGEIVIFDYIPINPNEEADIVIKYSESLDATNEREAGITVNTDQSWIELVLDKQLELKSK